MRGVLSPFSHVRLFVTPLTVAHQAPLFVGFSRQEYWSGLRCPLPGNLPDPEIESRSPALQADSLLSEPPGKPPSLFWLLCSSYWASLVAQLVKNPPAMQETWIRSLGWEDPLEEGPLQHSRLENPHGQRSLMGYSLWGCKALHTTE